VPIFAILSAVCLVLLVLGIGAHSLLGSPRGKGPIWLAIRVVLKGLRAIPRLIPGKDRSIVTWLIRLAILAAMGSFAGLFLTGFIPMFMGLRLSGYLLIAHVTFAPVFIISLMFLLLVRTQVHAFVRANAEWVMELLGLPLDAPLSPADPGLVTKGCFWAVAVLSLPLVLSSVMSMFPIFGTYGQELLFEVHRSTALVFTLVVLVHAYASVRHRVMRDYGVHVHG
jgi:hypothetical protein